MNETPNDQTQAQTEAAPKVRATPKQRLEQRAQFLRDRILEAEAELNAVELELDHFDALQNLAPNSQVLVTVGKGEKARTVNAVVVARAEDDNGVRYKVLYGQGFDAETAVVTPSQVQLIPAAQPAE